MRLILSAMKENLQVVINPLKGKTVVSPQRSPPLHTLSNMTKQMAFIVAVYYL